MGEATVDSAKHHGQAQERTEMIDKFTIIIGASKCGTTSLFNHLAEHPEICASTIKEPDFFASEERFARGRGWYESLWQWEPTRHKTALEASPIYSVYPVYTSAARRMAEMGASYKLIYIVRPQLEQIASNYAHALSMGSAWTDPDSGWWSGHRINRFFLCCASYAQQLDEYRRHFASDQILVLTLDDLRRDPAGLLRKACRFIGVEESFRFSNLSTVWNPTEGRILPPPGWREIRRLSRLRGLYRRLPNGLRAKLYSIIGTRATGPLELTREEKEYVLANLAHDIVRLREEYGLVFPALDQHA